jgi:hypothetical protein
VPWTAEADLNLDRDKEAEVQRRMGLLFVKLLVHMFIDGPRYIEPGTRARHGSAKNAKHHRTELWNVPFIGRSYVLSNGNGTHASPERHLRRSHVVRQAIGPRDQVLHVADLPRTPEGETDWNSVTEEMKARFWASHKMVKVKDFWVKDRIVNADAGEDTHQQPAAGNAPVQANERGPEQG